MTAPVVDLDIPTKLVRCRGCGYVVIEVPYDMCTPDDIDWLNADDEYRRVMDR